MKNILYPTLCSFFLFGCPVYSYALDKGLLPVFEELNIIHHPVSTKDPLAQQYFDQGLAFLYAFNYDAAQQSFALALKNDPQLAMGYWGIAMSYGPMLDVNVSPESEKKAYDAIQKAIQLTNPSITPSEINYIKALAERYTNAPNPDFKQLSLNYKKALSQIVKTYPDDLDAIALLAESTLDLNSDDLWSIGGVPSGDTAQQVDLLESALKRDPNHAGLNHFYLHMIEGSRHPERAEMSANRLAKLPTVLSHLVHSASHIYLILGDYASSVRVNQLSIAAVESFNKKYSSSDAPLVTFTNHAQLFLIRSFVMAGNYQESKKAAQQLKDLYTPFFKQLPKMECDNFISLIVLLRFQKWDEILIEPKPPADMHLSTAMWHYARTMALVSLKQTDAAEQSRQIFEKQGQEVISDNWPQECYDFMKNLMEAKFAENKSDLAAMKTFYQKTIAIQDKLSGEDFLFNRLLIARENYGGALLRSGRYEEAEVVFRKDLTYHYRNGRSLFGLMVSLKGQNKLDDAQWVERAYHDAWTQADFTLSINNL